ncbi:MAG: type I methionyl aminopeptidase [Candidatus Paceibacterota bacterium]|jgi:methionyl aminopeptidase
MITIKTPQEISALKEGGKILAEVLTVVAEKAVAGVKTFELDTLAYEMITKAGGKPAFLHYQPEGSPSDYPASLCVSINDEIVHGIPSDRRLKNGDIVGLDLGLEYKGLFTDMAVTVAVGKISTEDKKLINVAKQALAIGINAIKPGAKIGDVSYSIESYVKKEGLNVVRGLAGHGVGYSPHEDPFIPNYGKAGAGETIEEGMVLAIEPMVTAGSGAIKLLSDDWTFVTKTGLRSSHFEHTVVVTAKGAEILTK